MNIEQDEFEYIVDGYWGDYQIFYCPKCNKKVNTSEISFCTCGYSWRCVMLGEE